MIEFLYYSTVIVILIYLIAVFLYTCSLIISALDGAPYIKTDKNVRQKMFDQANITKKSRFIEIGSGSGELARYVEKKYRCNVVGLEVNPFLYYLSRLRYNIFSSSNIQFKRENAVDYNYAGFTHIYLFLLPGIIRKLHPILRKSCSKNTLVISYGFCIPPFKKYLIKKDDLTPYPIYYYKL